MDDNDWKAEEYRALRAEILANLDYQKNLVVFGTAGLATAFGFIFRDGGTREFTHVILFLTQVLAMGFWFVWVRIGVWTETIGTYICLYIESGSALNWEWFQRCLTRLEEAAAPRDRRDVDDDAILAKATGESPKQQTARQVSKKTSVSRFVASGMLLPFWVFSLASWLCIAFDFPGDGGKLRTILFQSHPPVTMKLWVQILSTVSLFSMSVYTAYVEMKVKKVSRLVREQRQHLQTSREVRERLGWHTISWPTKQGESAATEQTDRRG